VAFPAAGAGDGWTAGLPAGVGPDSERKIAPICGEGSGVTAASGARTGFSVPGVVSGAGEVAGKITTRGVAEVPGEGAFSAVAGVDAGDGLALSRSSDLLTR
jgi:hypothetical protein